MNKNRNILLLFGGAIILLIVAVILAASLGGDGAEEGTPNNNYEEPYNQGSPGTGESSASQTIGPITVYNPVAGWRLVENSEAGVSIKVPENWDISAEEGTFYYIAAATITNIAWANIYVESFTNPQNIDLKKWSTENLEVSDFIDIKIGKVNGLRYTTKATRGSQRLEESYIVGLVLPQGNKVVSVSCSAGGVEYDTLITTCENIISTFTLQE